MTRAQWLALLLGILLVSAPLIRAEEEEYEDNDDDDSDSGSGSGDEKDVVVITQANFEDKVKKSKFALVRHLDSVILRCRCHAAAIRGTGCSGACTIVPCRASAAAAVRACCPTRPRAARPQPSSPPPPCAPHPHPRWSSTRRGAGTARCGGVLCACLGSYDCLSLEAHATMS